MLRLFFASRITWILYTFYTFSSCILHKRVVIFQRQKHVNVSGTSELIITTFPENVKLFHALDFYKTKHLITFFVSRVRHTTNCTFTFIEHCFFRQWMMLENVQNPDGLFCFANQCSAHRVSDISWTLCSSCNGLIAIKRDVHRRWRNIAWTVLRFSIAQCCVCQKSRYRSTCR